ncbi:MAG: ABC transporter substrate-binding protein [Chloroflexi bacterium]|nr:ABC transporter substrate-binding protein [Chloroflexota bacterium]
MVGKRIPMMAVVLGAAVLVGLATGACGAAEEPTPTKAPAPAAATPTTASFPTAAPTPTARVVVGTATPAPAATPIPTGEQPKYGGIAVFAHRTDPRGWDHMRSSGGDLTYISMLIFGTGSLTAACRENQFQTCPLLAESWESNSNLTVWTFKIRDNVFWHDGTPFTAEDAKFWVELAKNGVKVGDKVRTPARYAATLGPIEKVEVVSGNKLQITLKSPVGAFPALFSQEGSTMVEHPRHLAQPQFDKGNVNVAPNEMGWVGTGPYKMQKYDQGVVARVRRSDKYWEKDKQGRQLPYADGIDNIVTSEQSTMFAAFRTGRLDRTAPGAGRYVTPEQEVALKKEMGEKAYVIRFPTFGKLVGINARKAPYNDVRVRQAISLWLDRQSYMDAIESGYGNISAVWFKTSPLANPDVLEWPGWNQKTKEQDRKRAKELLTQAGYPNGFKVNILTGQNWVNYAEWLKGQLDGLLGAPNVALTVFDTATYNAKLCQGAFELVQPLSSGVEARHSPEIVAGGYISTNSCSYVQHDDKKVDELFARIAAVSDQQERIRLGREIERYLSIESWLALNVGEDGANFVAFRSYVKGWNFPQVTPYSNGDYTTMWLDK